LSSIDNLLTKVTEQTLKELKDSLKGLEIQIDEILNGVEKETLKEIDKIKENFEREAQSIERRIISSAELEAKSKTLLILEETLNRAFREALKNIKDRERDEEYKETLKHLLKEGVDAVESKGILVEANEKDIKLLKDLVGSIKGKKVEVEEKPIECSGGLVVKSKDGSIIFSNTMEARLERMKPTLKRKLLEIIGREGYGS